MPALKPLVNILFVLLKLLFLYAIYAAIASGVGGLNTDKGQFNMEIPLFLLTAFPLYLGLKKQYRMPSILAVLPIFTLYFLLDFFYWSMGRVFQWIELGELYELIDVLSFATILVIAIACFTLGLLYIKIYKIVMAPLLIISLLPFGFTGLWSLVSPNSFLQAFSSLSYKVHYINLAKNVKDNGRLMTTFYLEAKRKVAVSTLQIEENWLEQDLAKVKSNLSEYDKRNIHILVFESLLDPTLFPDINLPNNYLSPWMQGIQEYRNLSYSPVYGGSTAQAEFEILCGTKAQALVGTIEFNSFSGQKTSCLASWLDGIDYRAVAQNAYKPSYFNQVKGYQGAGFTEIYFPKEYAQGTKTHLRANLTASSGEYMYDGDFFEQAISFIKNSQSHKQPLFNYMLGVYGHHNFHIDPSRFKKVVNLQSTKFSGIENIVNQYHYRAQVIEQAVKTIVANDPDAIVLIVSDHLPKSPTSVEYYLERGYPDVYLNVFYLFDRGVPIKFDHLKYHYQLPWLLIDLLMEGECSRVECNNESLDWRYEQVMANAMRSK